jgi:DNA-binding response OmpR family regulator
MRIALLEDDPVHAAFVMNALTANGYGCHEFSRGQALVHALRRESFDLLLLDWQIADMTGKDVLAWVRQNVPQHLPVMFLTSYARDDDIMTILNAGADDYLIKPVSAGVLLARVVALLRRVYGVKSELATEIFGEFQFDVPSGQAFRYQTPVVLTQREFTLALLLFQNLGRPLSRAHILERVWKQAADIPSRTMDTHIAVLRRKLGLRPEYGYRLAPVYGYGYRLERLADAQQEVSVVDSTIPQSAPASSGASHR